ATTRPRGSRHRNSGSGVDRCAVRTTDSPRSSRARAVCDPIEPRPPVMRIIQVAPRRVRAWSASLLDSVAQVGYSGCGHRLDQAQSDMGGQFLEEAAAVAEEYGNLVQDHLVEQSGAQRGRDDTAAHDRDVPIASGGASGLDAGFDGGDEAVDGDGQ